MLLPGSRLIILSTAYVLPTYLQTILNFRELRIGPVLLAIALPQLALCSGVYRWLRIGGSGSLRVHSSHCPVATIVAPAG